MVALVVEGLCCQWCVCVEVVGAGGIGSVGCGVGGNVAGVGVVRHVDIGGVDIVASVAVVVAAGCVVDADGGVAGSVSSSVGALADVVVVDCVGVEDVADSGDGVDGVDDCVIVVMYVGG